MKISVHRTGATLVLALALGGGIVSPTFALPPGGANTVNTAGTNSTIQTRTLKAGDVLKFTLTGFPAGEQVYVKIDNGKACPSDSAQGACVVHQQKADSSGTVNGSFILPKDLADGEHTLRFLATKVMKDSSGNQIGTEGYSNQSPAFTITGVNQDSAGGTVKQVDSSEINQTNTGRGQSSSQNNGSSQNSSNNSSNSESNTTSNQQNSNVTSSNKGGSAAVTGSESKTQAKANTSENTTQASNEKANSSAGVEEEIIYKDANGKVISKEEYDRLMSENPSAVSSSPASKTPEARTSAPQSSAPKASATASGTSSAAATSNASQVAAQASQASSQEAQSQVPWVGIIAVIIAAGIAAGVLIKRRPNA